MKRIFEKLASILLLGVASTASANPFINLGFEQADVSGVPQNGYGSTNQILPGWSLARSGIGSYNEVRYNPVGLTQGPDASIYDRNGQLGLRPVEGRYYLGLVEGLDSVTQVPIHFTLGQRGDIPSDTKSIYFNDLSGRMGGPTGNVRGLTLEVNGNPIPLVSLGLTLVGADISAYAGQNVELTFHTKQHDVPDFPPAWGVDDISFSSSPVTIIPEPTTCAIIGSGALLLVGSRSFRSRSLSQD